MCANKLRYAVIGCGAIGGYYGGRLALAGADVHFLFHSDYSEAVSRGLQVESINGDFLLPHPQAYRDVAAMPPCDVVMVSLKTVMNDHLTQLLPPLLKPSTLVILIQNGWGMERDLSLQFPELKIAGAMAFIASNKVGPAHVRHLDFGAITIGSYCGEQEALLLQVANDMSNAGIPVVLAPDLTTARWRKLVWNIPYNGLSVVLRSTTDQLMQHPDVCALIRDLMLEVIEASRLFGATIPESFADEMLEATRKMRPYQPSMMLDYLYHRPMEVEYLYSRPVREACERGFLMRKTQMLEQLLLFNNLHNVAEKP